MDFSFWFSCLHLVFNASVREDLIKKWNTPTAELIHISPFEGWSAEACWLVVSQAAVVQRNDSSAIKARATDVNVVKEEKRKHGRQTWVSRDVGHSSAATGEPSADSKSSSLGSHSGSGRSWKLDWRFFKYSRSNHEVQMRRYFPSVGIKGQSSFSPSRQTLRMLMQTNTNCRWGTSALTSSTWLCSK